MLLPHSVKQDRYSTNWAMCALCWSIHFQNAHLLSITIVSGLSHIYPTIIYTVFTQYFTICIEVELLYILIDDVIYTTIPPGCTLLSQWIDYSNAQTLVWNFLQVLELWLCKKSMQQFSSEKDTTSKRSILVPWTLSYEFQVFRFRLSSSVPSWMISLKMFVCL